MTIKHNLPLIETDTFSMPHLGASHEATLPVTGSQEREIAIGQAQPKRARRLGGFTLRFSRRSSEPTGGSLHDSDRPSAEVGDTGAESSVSHQESAQEGFEGESVIENWDEIRRAEIESDPLLDLLPPEKRAEAIANTYELYKAAKEKVAPVIVAFADSLLQEAGEEQIIFAARDGLGAYRAAHILKRKFEYANEDPEQLVYAYLTRAVVWDTPQTILAEYLKEIGVHDINADVLLADIGMYGSILRELREVLPNMEPRYLISKTSSVPGYADGQHNKMASIDSVSGNPAVHFLEDTFSGTMPSPTSIIHSDIGFVPNTVNESYPPEEMLKRTYAIKAIEDFAESLPDRPTQPAMTAINTLDSFLADPSEYKRLMVPHAR